ncbi:MAG: glycosyltransferase family 9 protein [Candidatus Fonsibacter sp.]|jgi:ADP-heptose:LPS heptosyltransferase|nr:glycosyltransferase family 9 protein [Candidatus Fonsibacter sp.]
MSNILIIKLGSLGDVVQISGALRDIREHHKNEKITILTTSKYINLFKNCPYVDNCLEDERLPRYNIFYLLRLRKIINSLNFNKVYDLQNSNRTNFYRKFLFNVKNWSSSRDIPENKYNNSVLQRFDEQLRKSNIQTLYTLKPDFSWAAEKANNYNLDTDKKYILFFPFCSRDLIHKRWPYFSELINLIKQNHPEYSLVVAPGPGEIEEAKSLDIKIALNNNLPLNFFELASLIKKSHLVIANDTGPAHMAAHLGARGFTLFGPHTTPEKVSIEREKFIALQTMDLKSLFADRVYALIKSSIIN